MWGNTDTLGSVPVNRNYNELIFEMGFSAIGDTLTAYFNRQAVVQAKDSAFTEGTVGIGTDNATGLLVTDIEMLIPNKASLVEDRRASVSSAKQPREGTTKKSNFKRPSSKDSSGDSMNKDADGSPETRTRPKRQPN